MTSAVERAIAAVRAGGVVVVPTDTVYGLAATAHDEAAVRGLYHAKGRLDVQPTALVAPSVETLLELVPELPERVLRALLPGPYTLVLPNPAGRFPWLCGKDATTIGVRVPAVDGIAREVLAGAGALAATSANLPGEPDPRTVDEIPQRLRDRVAAIVDGGPLPGVPSTVVDLTGSEPVILRAAAVPADVTLARLAASLTDP